MTNFYPPEVVCRCSDAQLQVGENTITFKTTVKSIKLEDNLAYISFTSMNID